MYVYVYLFKRIRLPTNELGEAYFNFLTNGKEFFQEHCYFYFARIRGQDRPWTAVILWCLKKKTRREPTPNLKRETSETFSENYNNTRLCVMHGNKIIPPTRERFRTFWRRHFPGPVVRRRSLHTNRQRYQNSLVRRRCLRPRTDTVVYCCGPPDVDFFFFFFYLHGV